MSGSWFVSTWNFSSAGAPGQTPMLATAQTPNFEESFEESAGAGKFSGALRMYASSQGTSDQTTEEDAAIVSRYPMRKHRGDALP